MGILVQHVNQGTVGKKLLQLFQICDLKHTFAVFDVVYF